jgi:hypothetical protein
MAEDIDSSSEISSPQEFLKDSRLSFSVLKTLISFLQLILDNRSTDSSGEESHSHLLDLAANTIAELLQEVSHSSSSSSSSSSLSLSLSLTLCLSFLF